MNRAMVLDFAHPAEHEPWLGYDEADVRDVLEKFSILGDAAVKSAIVYERLHKNRPAVVEYDKEAYEPAPKTQQPAAAQPSVPAAPTGTAA